MRMYKIFVTVFIVLFLLVGAVNDKINVNIQSSNGASGINDDAVLASDNLQSLEDSNGDLEALANSNDDSHSLMSNDDSSQSLEASKDFNGNSFSQLQTEINNCNANDTIKLNNDIYQNGSSQITIRNSITIDGNGHTIDAQGKSGIFNIQSYNLQTYVTFKNIVFKNANNRAIRSSSGITVSNCTFVNNSALSGSAIFLEVNDGQIEYCSFINNTAKDGSGGAIFLQGVVEGNGKNITVEHCSFENNHAAVKGGAIYSDGENCTINNCSFKDNSADEGGAIYNNYIAFISICGFTNNSASIGGAVYSVDICSLANCLFIANSAVGSGGAVYSVKNSHYVMECDFYNNSAKDGGAIHWTNNFGAIQYCNFIGNIAGNNGGALFLKEFTIQVISVSSFFNNTAINGGAAYFANASIDFDLSSFANNTALNGAAMYCFNSSLVLDFCHFNHNQASLDAGAIFLNESNASIVDSYFISNIAEEKGSAISSISEKIVSQLNITSSTFLSNKAKSGSLTVEEMPGALIVGFKGLNNYINAINMDAYFNINLRDVSYWSGEIVNSDDELYNTGRKGQSIVLEIYDSKNNLLDNTTLTTNALGESYYGINGLGNGTFRYKAYRLEDDYYTYVETEGNFTTNKSTSSIVLNISDYAEFPYNNCSIPFNVINRTVVRVLVTNENGSYVFINRTVDHFSNHITIDLGVLNEYYKITVFNGNNSAYEGSQDTKFFKIKRVGSSISIDDIDDLSYGQKINITFNVENKTSINITLYDEDGNAVFSEITLNDSIVLPVLPIGSYDVTLINRESRNVMESNYSTSFNILKADNVVSVSANNVTYGNYTLIVIRADVDGTYLLDVNGSLRNVPVAGGIGRGYCSLPVGEYYANVSFDDVNCNNFITNATFSVLKADNYVSVSFDNVFEGDKVTAIINASADGVYLLDVNGSLVNVTVAGGIGSVELSLSGDEYYANVTFDNENYNSYISNATWFKPNDVIIPPVLSDDGFGNIVLDLPEGSRGNLTVYVNHDQLASIKVYGGENIIPLHVSNYGENVVTVVFIDDAGFAYELSKTVYVKKPVEPFDIEFSNDSSILGFTAYMPEDVTGVLNVYVADNFYDVDIVDGKADFSISGLPNGFYVVNIEYLGDDNYEGFSQGFFVEIEQGDIDYDPGTIAVEHTGAGDSADIQAAIDKVNPGDVILLGNYDYVDVADVNITKPVIIEGNGGASITSSGDGTPIFNLPPISDGGPESLNIHGVVFKLSNGDTVVKAIADNDTDPLSIVTPSIKINGNSFELVNDTTVPESVTILELDSERGVLSPTEEISISGNTIAAGVKPFEFEITSVETGGDVNVGPQNITSNRKATVIVFENMNTTAVSQADGEKPVNTSFGD